MEYQLDIEPSDEDINEVRGGLIKHNTPFLEGIPKSQGCTSSLVDTLSFQVKPFYEKRGYECQMVLENYPVDSSLSFLTKSLVKK
ncbi:hypothetical protein [Vibrio splendidus]|uniref:hypothetical protein n=1 Tax=Vibrio splendidus TaxID=29497 RepID=UPI0021173F8D|nr:hypothetical protein [Vibrio splendidus]MCQ8868430.1 hypothetical protein [Vibrio splendidus]